MLNERLRRSPTTGELAAYLRIDPDEVIDSICADSNFRSLSLDHDDGEARSSGHTSALDGAFDDVEGMDAFAELCTLLPDRLRRVVEMRFIDEMKQSDIAHELGVSQVQVSRLLRSAQAGCERCSSTAARCRQGMHVGVTPGGQASPATATAGSTDASRRAAAATAADGLRTRTARPPSGDLRRAERTTSARHATAHVVTPARSRISARSRRRATRAR